MKKIQENLKVKKSILIFFVTCISIVFIPFVVVYIVDLTAKPFAGLEVLVDYVIYTAFMYIAYIVSMTVYFVAKKHSAKSYIALYLPFIVILVLIILSNLLYYA